MRLLSLFLLFFCISITLAQASEFIVKPKDMQMQPGETFVIQVYSTDIFLKEGHAELPPLVKVGVLQEENALTVDIKENISGTLLLGKIALMTGGSGLIIAQVMPRIWSDSPEAGIAEGDRLLLAEYGLTSTKTLEVEKFAKTLINSQHNDTLFKAQIGHKLEIVLLTNPAEVKLGGRIYFQVFLNKKPVQLPVNFTYAGYSNKKNTYYTTIATDKNGKGSATISRKGLWKLSTSLEKSFEKKVKKSIKEKKSIKGKKSSRITRVKPKGEEKAKAAEDTKIVDDVKIDLKEEENNYALKVVPTEQKSIYTTANNNQELSINISEINIKPKTNTDKSAKIQGLTDKQTVKETYVAQKEANAAEKEIAALKDFSNRQQKARKEAKGKLAVDGTLLQANYIFEIK